MSFAPSCCPICYEKEGWKKVDINKQGFSVGKAAVGAVFLGPIGLLSGALGKKKVSYFCSKCHFQHDYDA